MKNLLSLLLILGCFAVCQAHSIDNEQFIAKTKLVKENTINLTLANLQGHHTKIQLTNLDGKISYYSEWMEERNGYSRNLDVSDLVDGKYLLTVKNQEENRNQVIKIKDGIILFSHFN